MTDPTIEHGSYTLLSERDISVEALDQLTRDAEQLTFFGPQLVTEAIANNPRLVLLGEPGSGKSTALRYLTLTLAAAGLDQSIDLSERLYGWHVLDDQNHPLPIFFPLLRFARWLANTPGATGTAHELWNVLAEFLEPSKSNSGLASTVHGKLQDGHVLLLLDGLDEVATVESRRKVVRAVQQFADEYPQCRIIVTCRVRAYEGEHNRDWQLAGWLTATLADWTLGQMEYFVAVWYREAASGMDAIRRNDRIAALQRAIVARDELQRLGIRPLLLTVMALVHLNDGRLPEDSVSLYSRCIDILLAQWELGRNDGSEYGTIMDYIGLPDLTVHSLRPLLEEAAFRAHEASTPGSQGVLGRDALYYLVGKELHRLKHPNPWTGAERFLDYTDKRAGLLHASEAGDAYAFSLQTFQEYLAGLKLVSGVDPIPSMLERRADDRWYRPIAFGVGDHVSGQKLAMPYQLLQKLLQLKGRAPERMQCDVLLAADLGKEVGWDRLEQGDELFEGVRQNLAVALGMVVESTVLPAAERVRAGVFLTELGDPRDGVCTLPPKMIAIPGGSFVIGHTQQELDARRETLDKSQRAWFDDTLNTQPVPVAAFEIARYPVTNAQYKLFMDSDGYNPRQPWWDNAGRAWLKGQRNRTEPDYWNDARFGIARPNHPVVGVSWYEAVAFCRWLTQNLQDGFVYRLPTEAEWEYAARGQERRSYPWGDAAPDEERANYDERYDGTTAVGCFPLGATPEPAGVLDLAGNVWEWTRSVYAPYPYDPDDGREYLDDPARKAFAVRGGSWNARPLGLRASRRLSYPPVYHHYFLGFRLARYLSV